MPIVKQSYRTFDGAIRRRFRWWTVVVQEFHVLIKSRAFVAMLLAAFLMVFIRLLQVVAYDTLAANPNNPLALAFRTMDVLTVDSRMFFDFLRLQGPFVLVISIFAGAGMVCNDYRNNLMEIYFSKPLTWRDYVLGKILTLVLLGLALTALPALFLLILHNLLAPGFQTLSDTWWLPLAIVPFSLAIVLPCALGILAGSALFPSARVAGISVFMILFADMALGVNLAELLRNNDYYFVAFPFAVNHVGEHLFRLRRTVFTLHWAWSALYIAIVCFAALAVLCRKIRRQEHPA